MFKLRLIIGLPDEKNKNLNQKKPNNFKDLCGVIAVFQVLHEETSEIVHPDEIASTFGTDEASEVELPNERVNFRDIPIPKVFELLRTKFKSKTINTNADINICIGSMNYDLIDDFIPRERYRNVKDSELISHYNEKIKELKNKFI